MDGDWRARYHPEQQMAARVAMSSTLTAENTGFIATVLTSITVMELPVVGVWNCFQRIFAPDVFWNIL